ncbi:MAG: dNTP triphosphohydrolase [bacterium]|nr:dNTP triphosphohydrolase [bacterium]
MLYTQPKLFTLEDKTLAPYALRSSQSRGRKFSEVEDLYRTPFQRDRDRIIHSKAFRRLSGKTQVFVSSYGDHYRSRLTHSLEVAQVARDIAVALGLNQDLCETIALAHDLGHTPFGHAGEEAMSEMMARFNDYFEHNEQSRRIVEKLEIKSPDYPGLNLTLETIEGMMKHRKFHDDGKTPVIHSLEAQVVDLADAIAYHHHDLDDGLRSGILKYELISDQIELWRMGEEDLSLPQLGEALYRHMVINRIISLLIHDVIEESSRQLVQGDVLEPLEYPNNTLIRFSERQSARVEELADFLGEHFYLHQKVSSMAARGQKVIKSLFELYSQKDELLPAEIRVQFEAEKRHVVIKDYIAGMTDEFALKIFEEYRDML